MSKDLSLSHLSAASCLLFLLTQSLWSLREAKTCGALLEYSSLLGDLEEALRAEDKYGDAVLR